MRAAGLLTLERGFDGWTMDELAEASEVSRRTLFNYCPTKVDAVLGPGPDLSADLLAEFVGGGPTGVLIEDCRVLARQVLAEEPYDRQQMLQHRRAVLSSPRLLLAVHERFEDVIGEVSEHILAREGRDFGADRAALLVRLLVTLFDSCLGGLADLPDDRPIAEAFDEALQAARELFSG